MFYLTRFSYLINFNLNRDTIIAPYVNHRRDVRFKSIKLGFVIRIRVEKLRATAKQIFLEMVISRFIPISQHFLYNLYISRYNIIEKREKVSILECNILK